MYYLTEIKEQLLKAITLVEEYEQNGFDIDRQTALDLIRRAYEELRFYDAQVLVNDPTPTAFKAVDETESTDEPDVEVEIIVPEPTPEPEPVVEPTPEPVPEPEPEPVVEPTPEPVPEPEPVVEPVVEPTPEPEPEPEPAVEPVEPAKVVITEPSLFGDDDQWTRPTPSRRRLISLYQDDAHQEPKPRQRRKSAEVTPEPKAAQPDVTPAPTPAPIPTPTPAPTPAPEVAEDKVVLADTIETPQTIADTIPSQPSIGQSGAVTTLRSAISVGDRFMLIRELFGGDEAAYERTIDTLENFDNLDDCIIFIAENFTWRASSEGAKLVMDLLQRKLS